MWDPMYGDACVSPAPPQYNAERGIFYLARDLMLNSAHGGIQMTGAVALGLAGSLYKAAGPYFKKEFPE